MIEGCSASVCINWERLRVQRFSKHPGQLCSRVALLGLSEGCWGLSMDEHARTQSPNLVSKLLQRLDPELQPLLWGESLPA